MMMSIGIFWDTFCLGIGKDTLGLYIELFKNGYQNRNSMQGIHSRILIAKYKSVAVGIRSIV